MTLIQLNLLSLILWPRMWSTLVNVPRALEENLYGADVGRVSCEYQCDYAMCSVWLQISPLLRKDHLCIYYSMFKEL